MYGNFPFVGKVWKKKKGFSLSSQSLKMKVVASENTKKYQTWGFLINEFSFRSEIFMVKSKRKVRVFAVGSMVWARKWESRGWASLRLKISKISSTSSDTSSVKTVTIFSCCCSWCQFYLFQQTFSTTKRSKVTQKSGVLVEHLHCLKENKV